MPGALVISVGATPEPVVLTLRQEAPDFVCFFVSQRSVDLVGNIKSAAAQKFDDVKVLVEDPEDLIACYEKAVECLRRTEEKGWRAESITVDYTGGTKAMTAALAMAAVSRGLRFSYVGGRERDKNGLGRVVTGTELRRVNASPWQIFAVEERKRAAQYFNVHQYRAAAISLRSAAPRTSERDRRVLEVIAQVADAYAEWDRFEHDRALQRLAPAKRELEILVSGNELREFISGVAAGVEFLGRVKSEGAPRRHRLLLGDLLANAERRLEEGKFDDAVARFYRALELQGQIVFQEVFGASTSGVAPERLPEQLREEYVARYSEGSVLKLPLYATYRALAETGHPVGERFREAEGELRKVVESRNSSVLAHGLRAIGEAQARRVGEIARSILIGSLELPRFPRLPW